MELFRLRCPSRKRGKLFYSPGWNDNKQGRLGGNTESQIIYGYEEDANPGIQGTGPGRRKTSRLKSGRISDNFMSCPFWHPEDGRGMLILIGVVYPFQCATHRSPIVGVCSLGAGGKVKVLTCGCRSDTPNSPGARVKRQGGRVYQAIMSISSST